VEGREKLDTWLSVLPHDVLLCKDGDWDRKRTKMAKVSAYRVFTPGGMPTHTLVPRDDTSIYVELDGARHGICQFVVITGNTKCGKTVLVRSCLSDAYSLTLHGGQCSSADAIWNEILAKCGGHTSVQRQDTRNDQEGLEAESGVSVGVGPVKGSIKRKTSSARSQTTGQMQGLERASCPAAVEALTDRNCALIIDDFHYLSPDVQGEVVRALKPAVFDGLPVLLLAVPHRRYAAVKVEEELGNRVKHVPIPPWGCNELGRIGELGFPVLKLAVADEIIEKLAVEAHGSGVVA